MYTKTVIRLLLIVAALLALLTPGSARVNHRATALIARHKVKITLHTMPLLDSYNAAALYNFANASVSVPPGFTATVTGYPAQMASRAFQIYGAPFPVNYAGVTTFLNPITKRLDPPYTAGDLIGYGYGIPVDVAYSNGGGNIPASAMHLSIDVDVAITGGDAAALNAAGGFSASVVYSPADGMSPQLIYAGSTGTDQASAPTSITSHYIKGAAAIPEGGGRPKLYLAACMLRRTSTTHVFSLPPLYRDFMISQSDGANTFQIINIRLVQQNNCTQVTQVTQASIMRATVSTDFGDSWLPGVDVGFTTPSGAPITDGQTQTAINTSYDKSGANYWNFQFPQPTIVTTGSYILPVPQTLIVSPGGKCFIRAPQTFSPRICDNAVLRPPIGTDGKPSGSAFRNAATVNQTAPGNSSLAQPSDSAIIQQSAGAQPSARGKSGQANAPSALYMAYVVSNANYIWSKSLDGGDTWVSVPLSQIPNYGYLTNGTFGGPGGPGSRDTIIPSLGFAGNDLTATPVMHTAGMVSPLGGGYPSSYPLNVYQKYLIKSYLPFDFGSVVSLTDVAITAPYYNGPWPWDYPSSVLQNLTAPACQSPCGGPGVFDYDPIQSYVYDATNNIFNKVNTNPPAAGSPTLPAVLSFVFGAQGQGLTSHAIPLPPGVAEAIAYTEQREEDTGIDIHGTITNAPLYAAESQSIRTVAGGGTPIRISLTGGNCALFNWYGHLVIVVGVNGTIRTFVSDDSGLTVRETMRSLDNMQTWVPAS